MSHNINPVLACSDISFSEKKTPTFYQIEISTELKANVDTVWNTLTDYSNLQSFITNLRQSLILVETRSRKIIEQTGIIRLPVFTKQFKILLDVQEEYPTRIKMAQIDGDFDFFKSEYQIIPTDYDHVQLTWQGKLLPAFYIPSFIGKTIININIKNQFCDLINEVSSRVLAEVGEE